jgi:non-ribosomal peptide synthetase component F/alpha-ketoglutarate-dependent taurine dioxygenase
MKNIDDLYKLSPVQQDLLTENQVGQAVYALHGPLDPALFNQAWERAIARHDNLRAAFFWKNLEKPVQAIQQNVSLPITYHDDEDIAAFIDADRRRGFDLNRAPLMRLSVFRLGADLHQLVWTYHRLVLDEASVNLIIAEVFGGDTKSESGSFKRYISWLRQQDPSQAESFWTNALNGCESPTMLVGVPLSASSTTKQQQVQLSASLSSELQAFIERHQLRMSSLLTGAWALLLSRYNDEDESLFGLGVSGRPRSLPGVEAIAGRFSHVLPVRLNIGSKETVLSWLKAVDEKCQEIERHQHVGQQDIGRWSNLASAFESVAAVVPEMQPISAGDLKVELLDHLDDLDHPLHLTLSEGSPVSLSIRYDRSRFADAFIKRILEQLKSVLETLISQPEQRVSDVSLLTAAERQQLSAEWEQSSKENESDTCVHTLFEKQVSLTPQATALVFGEQSLTYRELNERANQLAQHLRSLGLRPETNVAVCMYRSVETVVALLAILKAGGVYVPLDPQLPSERLSFIVEETDAQILLTQQDLLFHLPPIVAAVEVVCLDLEWDTIAQHDAADADSSVSTAQTAYIIYTSGSTGRPKGVCIPHSAAASHLSAIKLTFGLTPSDRVLQFASLSFDVSIEQILAPLLAGATVVLRPEQVWNVTEFWQEVVDQQLTVLNLPPAYWNQITKELGRGEGEIGGRGEAETRRHGEQDTEGHGEGETRRHGEEDPRVPASPFSPSLRVPASLLSPSLLSPSLSPSPVRLMIVGGDLMPPEVVQRWQNSPLGNVRLLNAYGPTETTVTSTVFELPPDFMTDNARIPRVPIGHKIGRRQLYVLDRDGQLVIDGGRGELFIGGTELARGYFNDPGLTAARFLPDPFTSEAGGRMYSTGDLVRRLSGGELEYEVRRDGQVKVRGYRIELGDIETALGAQEEVSECAVALKERDGEKRLVGYVVLRPDSLVQAWELRARLKERLPEHMIPAALVELESLPLTTSGKVDRRALPDPEPDRPEQEASFVEPRDETEEQLVQMWTRLLGIVRIGVFDNFFEAGGDSLLATQLIAQVNKNFQVSVPLRVLFDEPTIADLSRNIEVYRSLDEELPESIEPGLRVLPLPLSYAQERLWFMAQLQKDSPLFNIATAVQLRGELQFEPLEQTFTEIIRRHEVLRTVFELVDDAPAQVILEPQPFSIPVTDLGALAESEQRAEVLRLINEETKAPFDLSKSLPLRVSLLSLGRDDHVMILTMHHIVSDGWSIGVLVREVAELYAAFCAGLPSPLPDLPIQYADFAVWQRRWLQGNVLEDHLAYWRKELAGKLPESPLAGDHPRPAVSSFAGVTRTFELSKSLTGQLKDLARAKDTTLFMTLMAAFQTLLHRESGNDDIVVGTDVANRNRTETADLIGFFVNLLPVRTRPSANLTFREYLQQVKDVTLGAYDHQDLPFDRIVTELQPERSLNRAPLFQTLFVMQNAPMPETKLDRLQLSQMEVDEGVAKFDLAVFMEEKDERLIGKWNYSTDLFVASTIERLADRFSKLLESIVANPEAKLGELEIRSAAETVQETRELQQQQDVKRSLLRKARRQSVRSIDSMIKTSYLPGCEGLPLVIEPATNDVELVEWAGQSAAFIETELLKHGALLFRNFNTASVKEFERFAAAICDDLFSEYGDLPREQMSPNVYGSTPYPSNQAILFHNESSHLDRWPMKIWFFCLKAAESGGETPIVDCRKVYNLLSPSIRDRFAEKGIRYVRTFTEGLDVSWSDFFRTAHREQVEKQCAERRIECTWGKGDELQTSKARPAVARHPATGEMVFFNQLQLHHVSCLEPSVRESLLNTVGEERLPRNVYYRDGSRIDEVVMAEVEAAYQQAKISFPWQEGDIMLLDNMLVAHGRSPFVGERKIVVALGKICHEEAEEVLGQEEIQKTPLSVKA